MMLYIEYEMSDAHPRAALYVARHAAGLALQ